jgi:hypothetical protein
LFEPLAQFARELKSRAASSNAYDKVKAFMEGITPEPSASHSP